MRSIIIVILTITCGLAEHGSAQGDRFVNATSRVSATPSSNTCAVPPQPKNGNWRLHKSQCCPEQDAFCDHCNPRGDIEFDVGRVLVYRCNPGFSLSGPSDVICGWSGTWFNVPECVEIRCKSLLSNSIFADCTKPGGGVGSCEFPLPGTRATLKCRPGYRQEIPYIKNTEYTCDETGYWEPEPIRCIPACGLLFSNSTPLIANGTKAKVNEFPWHATLYEAENPGGKKEFICGATIIREDLLVTAAHCVYNEAIKQFNDPTRYYVATGNTNRDYDNPFDNTDVVQNSRVKKIYNICTYFGYQGNYASDIAILEIERRFQFTFTTLPVCLDIFNSGIEPGAFGKVAGFGRTGFDASSSFVLQTISVPYVPFSKCKALSVAHQSLQLITEDKFCAGYKNGSSVCDGDSGGGLVFKNSFDGLWYLQGIVSTGIGSRDIGGTRVCNSFTYSLYTRVSKYTTWIQDTMQKLATHKPVPPCPLLAQDDILNAPATKRPITAGPVNGTCIVPAQPQNGYRKLHKSHCCTKKDSPCDDCDVKQDTVINSGTGLIYGCDHGFQLNGPNYTVCEKDGALVIPECIEIRCKSLLYPASVIVSCTGADGNIRLCKSPLPGTRAKIECRPGYLGANQRKEYACSETGNWEPKPEPIRCVPACGLPAPEPLNIPSGILSNASGFPWHATLYAMEKPETKKEHICGATIISENLLLTAAHCIYDDVNQKPNNPRRYYVAAGNTYRDYDNTIDEAVERSRVKNIYIPCSYTGYVGNFASDIAMLEIEQPFLFSPRLGPICLDFFQRSTDSAGKVVGFGRNSLEEQFSPILRSLEMSYVSKETCRSQAVTFQTDRYVTEDKFCRSGNGSTVCFGYAGGGLVSEIAGLWYVQGIVSVTFNLKRVGNTVMCDSNAYSLYTEVSYHISWIQDIMAQVEAHSPVTTCFNPNKPNDAATTASRESSSCIAPLQPKNGYWELLSSQCCVKTDGSCGSCEGAQLKTGTFLVYGCNLGFKLKGSSHVSCNDDRWSNTPQCIEIRCKNFDSSVSAECTVQNGTRVSCKSAAYETRAKLECRSGYRPETTINGSSTVRCNESGDWEPRPMRCVFEGLIFS